MVNGREIYVESGPGISTAAYRDRGLGYVVTADLDEDALTRLVTTVVSRRLDGSSSPTKRGRNRTDSGSIAAPSRELRRAGAP